MDKSVNHCIKTKIVRHVSDVTSYCDDYMWLKSITNPSPYMAVMQDYTVLDTDTFENMDKVVK